MPLDSPLEAQYATIDDVPEAFRDLYEERGGQFHIAKINGIKTDADVTRVTRALEAEKTGHAKLKQQWGGFFGDKKPEEIQAILDRVPELEIAASGKIDDNKMNELVEGRLRTKLGPVERELQQTKAALSEKDQKIAAYEEKDRVRTIHDGLRGEAAKAKVIDTALEDVLMLAERLFEIDDKGNLVTKDIQGVTPGLSPAVWLTEMKQKRPHWWPASSGGGAGGGMGGGGFADNPFSAESWNMTKQGQIQREDPTKAAQMAKAAGTTVGGPKPMPRK